MRSLCTTRGRLFFYCNRPLRELSGLEPGTALGPYSVTAKIGEDGMGEVYRARDTKLDRDVALKVLPKASTGDPSRGRKVL